MADNIWDNSDGDNDGNVAANWSLGWVPKGGDVAVFDSATTNDNCTFSGNISCDGMRFDNTYSGTVDAATYNIVLGSDGLDCTGGSSATLDLGSGTWTCSGDWDVADLSALDDGSSTLELTGTADVITKALVAHAMYDVVIKTGADITCATKWYIDNSLEIEASSELTVNWYTDVKRGTLTLAGTLNGTGTITLYDADATNTGSWDVANTRVRRDSSLSAGTYGGTFLFECDNSTRTLTFGSGTITFTGNVTFDQDLAGQTYTIDNNSTSLVFEGDVTVSATGGGTIT